jgi:hypothetical protein
MNELLIKSRRTRLAESTWKTRHRWDNVELDVKEIGSECVDWINLAQIGSLVGSNEHSDFIKARGYFEYLSFSERTVLLGVSWKLVRNSLLQFPTLQIRTSTDNSLYERNTGYVDIAQLWKRFY